MLSSVRSSTGRQLSCRALVSLRQSCFISSQSIPKSEGPLSDTSITTSQQTSPLVIDSKYDGNNSLTQAPNKADVWSKSQNPRSVAMSGPRFEQTIFELQPAPHSAMELIHKQPVRWSHERVVVCDGGGGPLGHPRTFINIDKPQVCVCEYCGLPFANEHHRKQIEALPSTPYPLS
ncbi:BgTH12-00957 [Blumeria graminis f. sp. triticale]|uniref:Bgt-2654 n=3 Tax=Blumeria graminis TaxID=34373 RepID=A0A061HKC1_BLUGR|nr:NADH-ubiquinone oxidoreductase [Blumeria graminis f. sp. tritici 96224]CAD6505466.1 BgTH12-00957 [Blumeria graminis f. sp. triticale]VDB93606.1 Bgt-2654 [Blumeria graminis f. sp. tritici]